MIKTLSQRTLWYGRRLSSMSGRELGHRVEEQAKRAVARFRTPSFDVGGVDRLPVLPELRDGLAAFAGDAHLRDAIAAAADRAESGRFALLGVEWPTMPPGPARWHLDPTTGRSWPAADYCFSIPYRHAPGMGDVKYVWELNRLPHVQALAAAAVLEGDAGRARRCAAEIDSWIDANPPFRGVNWASGIELALRSVSILFAVTLLGDDAFSPRQRRRILATLAAHGYWLFRYPSRFSSANNHLVAEAGGLFLLGTLASGLDGATAWAAYGREVLTAEAGRQIHADGVGAEQSPTYTAFTLEWLLLCGTVARRLGRDFPAAYWERIAAAAAFLRAITDAGGNQPRIGDDDEGRVLAGVTGANPVGGILSAVAHATGRTELAPPVAAPDLRDLVFGPALSHAQGPAAFRCFRDGGYAVARTGDGAGECLMVFDHGPLGYLSIAAHGHADALALWCHVGGVPVLADAGTYLYHAGGRDRDHFRGTPAHNTLSVAGADSSRMAGAFNWSEKAQTRLVDCAGDADAWVAEAEHDGFRRRFGVSHRRRVAQLRPGVFTVEDRLVGPGGPVPVEIGFLAHPEIDVIGADRRWQFVRDGRTILTIDHDGPLDGAVVTGAETPPRGWYSPCFGSKTPTARLTFTGTLATDTPCAFHLTVDGSPGAATAMDGAPSASPPRTVDA